MAVGLSSVVVRDVALSLLHVLVDGHVVVLVVAYVVGHHIGGRSSRSSVFVEYDAGGLGIGLRDVCLCCDS